MLFFLKEVEEGQGLPEYALILTLMALVVIAALVAMTPYIDDIYLMIIDAL